MGHFRDCYSFALILANFSNHFTLVLSIYFKQEFPEVESSTVKGILGEISKERHGETVDRTLLKNILRMLSNLGIYRDSFEKPFLAETETYCAKESVNYLQQSDIAG